MKLSKQFAAWVTASKGDPFVRARWKLTFLYGAVLTFVVLFLSVALYGVHENNIREEHENHLSVGTLGADPERLESVLNRYLEDLGKAIVELDALTILVGGALGYWLAGRTLRPIRDSVRSEKQFFAGAAHDLRTPLAVMKAEIEVAFRSAGQPDQAWRVLGSSLEEIDRMSKMTEEMLALASLNSLSLESKVVLAREKHDVYDLVTTGVERWRTQAAEKRIELAVVGRPLLAKLNADAFDRVLGNLVDNALKYTPIGGTVRVGLRRNRSHFEVSVQDTGIGIAAADLSRITEPFFRADAARNSPGSGLGLAIVAAIVERHRGSLKWESELGKGTLALVRLPLR